MADFQAPLDEALIRDEKKWAARQERVYRCAMCGTVITGADDRFRREGAAESAFVNPAGYLFRLGYFRRAPGALPGGPETDQHSWFPGLAWRCVFCRDCQNHLGWRFSGEESGFFGLILDRLI